jgi:hypothetical protein
MEMATRHCMKWAVGVWKGNTSNITYISNVDDIVGFSRFSTYLV